MCGEGLLVVKNAGFSAKTINTPSLLLINRNCLPNEVLRKEASRASFEICLLRVLGTQEGPRGA